jgi:hypothetical protein
VVDSDGGIGTPIEISDVAANGYPGQLECSESHPLRHFFSFFLLVQTPLPERNSRLELAFAC